MEMVIVVTLGAIVLAVIGQQYDSMRQIKRMRVKTDKRNQR